MKIMFDVSTGTFTQGANKSLSHKWTLSQSRFDALTMSIKRVNLGVKHFGHFLMGGVQANLPACRNLIK